jgi:hypothetical protein
MGVVGVEVSDGSFMLGMEEMVYEWCDCWYGVVMASNCRGVGKTSRQSKGAFHK